MTEQLGNFHYAYSFRCENCSATTTISAEAYQEKRMGDPLIPCSQCGSQVHIGPNVAAIRNVNDPALDNTQIERLSWYHTSTFADWPSPHFAATMQATLRQHTFPGLSTSNIVDLATGKALHLGTYEAAIENMFRRIHDQRDAEKTFYLHHVTINLQPREINNGFLDENQQDVSQITVTEIESRGLRAMRYMNAWEAPGSLSLAVLPTVISEVRTVRLPIIELAPAPDEALATWLHSRQEHLDALIRESPVSSGIDPLDLRLMTAGLRPDPSGVADTLNRLNRQAAELWQEVELRLMETHLVGVSPVVIEAFMDALKDWVNATDPSIEEYSTFFAASAVMLTRPQEVRDLLLAQPARRPGFIGT